MSASYNARRETLTIECNHCEESDSFTDEPSFGDGWLTAIRHGWRAYRNGNEWTHSCKSCSTDMGVL
jgi:hypothetical protein